MFKIKKHFTLIELLIVIAIIAILASLLLPALKNAREKGKIVSCLSKMKQMHTAFNIYSSDYNGWIPCARWHYDGMSNFYYFDKLYVYSPSLFSKPQYDNGNSASNPACPAMNNEEGIDVGAASNPVNYSSSRGWGGYGVNFFTGYSNTTDSTYEKPRMRYSSFKYPAATLELCDTYTFGTNEWGWDCQYPYVAFRHQNGVNVLFMDSHAEWMKKCPSSALTWRP
jgi:prepilin-type N-terminal cleavage/methylation domain-containing protein/prepilin-type processing-associated H-X9-DG protein